MAVRRSAGRTAGASVKNGDVGPGRNTGRFASYIVQKEENRSKGGPGMFVQCCKMAVEERGRTGRASPKAQDLLP